MKFDDRRTDPRASDVPRSGSWFCWNDDAPSPHRAEHAGGAEGHETRDDTARAGNANGAQPSLHEERLNALRRWIADGGHNTPEVAEQVARLILERGDV